MGGEEWTDKEREDEQWQEIARDARRSWSEENPWDTDEPDETGNLPADPAPQASKGEKGLDSEDVEELNRIHDRLDRLYMASQLPVRDYGVLSAALACWVLRRNCRSTSDGSEPVAWPDSVHVSTLYEPSNSLGEQYEAKVVADGKLIGEVKADSYGEATSRALRSAFQPLYTPKEEGDASD